MKHRCMGCQRVYRLLDYEAGKAFYCEECGGRLQTMAEGADPRLVHNPELDLFEPESLLGQVVGPYRLISVLGSGGAGAVFLAVRPGCDEEVAVKILHPKLATDKRAVHRFLREARTIGRLSDPALLSLLDSGEAGTPYGALPYMATEYAPGGSLVPILEEGPLEPRRAAEIARGVASGLAVAHEAGVVHRDVKPGNILLDSEGRARIADFGLARVDGSVMLTATKALLGTPHYIAPEQVAERELDGRADIYSLGATLYHFLTGRPPFLGRLLQVLRSHANEEPVPPSRLRPDLPEGFDEVILRMLAKRPEDRYPSCRELALDLGALASGKPPEVCRRIVEESAARKGKPRPRPRYLRAIVATVPPSRLLAWGSLAIAWAGAVAVLWPAGPMKDALPFLGAWALVLAAPAFELRALARGRPVRRPWLGAAASVAAAGLTVLGAFRAPGLFAAAAGILPVVGLLAALGAHARWAVRSPRSHALRIGPGDAFPRARLIDHDGYPVELDEHRGRPALYVFQCGPGCPWCLVELGELGRRLATFQDAGVRLVAVDLLDPPVNRRLRQRIDFDAPVLTDVDEALVGELGIGCDGRLRPALVAVDEAGLVTWVSQTDDHRVRLPAEEVLARLGLA